MHFAPDDMQNAYTYWSAGWWRVITANLLFATSFYRPAGGLFYLPMLKLFGFNPLPFRIVLLVPLCLNVLLLYWLALRLSKSRETAGFAALLGCFHAAAAGVYFSNAMIYEILCFTFLTGALLYYVRIRQSGRTLTIKHTVILAALFVGALDSKEMAVVLPAVLVIYELLYRPWLGPSRAELTPLLLTSLMSGLYLAGKLFGANTLTHIETYRPAYTVDRFVLTSGTYLADLLFIGAPLGGLAIAGFWVGLFVVGAILRRGLMLFGAAFAFLSFLPLNFVSPRQGFVLYIPMIGFALYASGAISALLDLTRVPVTRSQVSAMIFIACLIALIQIHLARSQEEMASMLHAQGPTWTVLQELARTHPRVKPAAKILLVDSPIVNDWDIYFIAKLYFHDPELRAAWMRSAEPTPRGDVSGNFDAELRFQGNTLTTKTMP